MIADPPKSMVIETTQVCSLRCPYCPTGKRLIHRPALMPWGLFTKIADEIESFAKAVYLVYLGEPLRHPRLGDMIRRIKEFATIDLATNGVLVTKRLAQDIALCDVVSVTICGLGDVYAQIHGLDRYKEAMRGLKRLRDAKGKVNWTWIALRQNEHQIEEARALAAKMGVRFHLKTCALGTGITLVKDLIPVTPELSRYDEQGRLLCDRLRDCREFWEVGYICSDGTVIFCCFDYAGLQAMGSVTEQPFLEIWNGSEYQKIRREHLAGKLQAICRHQCGNNPKGWYKRLR